MYKMIPKINFLFFLIFFSLSSIFSQDEKTQSSTTQVEPSEEQILENLQNVDWGGAINIIGTKKKDLKRIPGTATIIGEDYLEENKPADAAEVLKTVPGANLYQDGSSGLNLNLGFRGVTSQRSRKVLILEDGIFTSLNPYGSPEQYYTPVIDRMERVEVVKGSGAILFGPSTIGGVVNFITRKPPKKPTLEITTMGGSYGFISSLFSYGGTFGKAGFDINYLRKQSDGAINHRNYQIDELNLKTHIKMNKKHSLTSKTQVHIQDANITYLGQTTAQFKNAPQSNLAEQDNRKMQRFAFSLAEEWKYNKKGSLLSQVYFTNLERNWARQKYTRNLTDNQKNPNDTIAKFDTEPFIEQKGDTIYLLDGNWHRNRQYRFSGIEFRLKQDFTFFDINNELDAGIRYHYDWAHVTLLEGKSTPDIALFDDGYDKPATKVISSPYSLAKNGIPIEEEEREAKAFSAYLQNNFEITDKFSFIPGIRYEEFSQFREIRIGSDFDSLNYKANKDKQYICKTDKTGNYVVVSKDKVNDANAQNSGLSNCEAYNSRPVDRGGLAKHKVLLPGYGVTYDINYDLTWFAGSHRGFSPPRYADSLDPNGVVIPLESEYSWNYETGVRGDVTKYLYTQITVYNLDYKNQIITSSAAGGNLGNKPTNAGKTFHRGLESDFSFDLAKFFNLVPKGWKTIPFSVVYTYTDAKFKEDNINWSKLDKTDTYRELLLEQKTRKGKYIPYVSKDIYSVSIKLHRRKGFYTRLEHQYFSMQYSDDMNSKAQPWVDLVDDKDQKDLLNYFNIKSSVTGLYGTIPGYGLINLSMGYKPSTKDWRLFLTITNLENKKYITSRLPEGIQPGAFRQINFGFSYSL